MKKQELYESIMANVAKCVKRALNENDFIEEPTTKRAYIFIKDFIDVIEHNPYFMDDLYVPEDNLGKTRFWNVFVGSLKRLAKPFPYDYDLEDQPYEVKTAIVQQLPQRDIEFLRTITNDEFMYIVNNIDAEYHKLEKRILK